MTASIKKTLIPSCLVYVYTYQANPIYMNTVMTASIKNFKAFIYICIIYESGSIHVYVYCCPFKPNRGDDNPKGRHQ